MNACSRCGNQQPAKVIAAYWDNTLTICPACWATIIEKFAEADAWQPLSADLNDLNAFYKAIGDVPDAGFRVAQLRAAEVRRRGLPTSEPSITSEGLNE